MLTTKVAGYKGKTVRSWAELPTEAIQSLATWHLNITAPTRPLPATWDFYTNPEHKHRYIPYPEYLIYVAARDAKAVEALMCVCTRWGVTLEQHPFWTHAIQCFDPYGACAHFAWSATFSSGNATSSFVATTPFHHFRAILHTSCLPCRINFPQSNTGLGSARWTVNTLRLGMVNVCGEHFSSAGGDVNTIDVNSRRSSRHCSVCLVDGDLAKRARDDAVRVARDELKRAEWAVAQAVVVGCGYEGWQAVGDAAAAGSGPAFAGSGSVGADLVSSPRGATNERQAQAAHFLQQARAVVDQAYLRLQHVEQDAYGRDTTGGRGRLAGDTGLAENEDDCAFPGAKATCRSCRAEWLWRCAVLDAGLAREGHGVEMVSGGLPITAGALFVDVDVADFCGGERRKDDDGAGAQLTESLGMRVDMPGYFSPQEDMKVLVSAYVECGEGTIERVLGAAKERGWLRANTRWGDLRKQALASRKLGDADASAFDDTAHTKNERSAGFREGALTSRMARSSVDAIRDVPYANDAAACTAYASTTIPDECYDEDSSESDDDPLGNEEDESLDMAVKEMALTDWARARVLDGAWAAPADVHHRMKDGVRLADADPYVPAVHPVHWSVCSDPSAPCCAPSAATEGSVRAIGTVGWIDAASQCHPGPPTQPPPTQCLAEKANNAFVKQMRSILLPVFSNVVRRLVIDYAIDPVEVQASLLTGAANSSNPPQHITQVQGRKPLPPAICAARMTIAEVVQQLREEVGLWFDGPQLLREIPHVPQSIDHLSQNSKEVLIIIWREACTPLYQCRCSICERATLVQAALQGETSDATKIIDKAQAKGNTPRHCIMPMHAEDDNETGAVSLVAKEIRGGKWASGAGGYGQDDSFSLDGAEDETIRDEKPFLFHPTPATWAAPPHIFPKLSEADEGCAEVHHPSSAKTSRKRACNLQGDPVDAMDAASVGSALKRSRVDLI
ncbi:hypothetical protein R3P38DRAFT_3050266 [Favolaschia claudopus]|uniref:Uncharacterized protein n=1 Tax=Favolaschia claudopus TaxID=2862362 RepID=A0AAW0A508_9AGAR